MAEKNAHINDTNPALPPEDHSLKCPEPECPRLRQPFWRDRAHTKPGYRIKCLFHWNESRRSKRRRSSTSRVPPRRSAPLPIVPTETRSVAAAKAREAAEEQQQKQNVPAHGLNRGR